MASSPSNPTDWTLAAFGKNRSKPLRDKDNPQNKARGSGVASLCKRARLDYQKIILPTIAIVRALLANTAFGLSKFELAGFTNAL